jgi:predicted negative regulator of RcsB-dependent stress response
MAYYDLEEQEQLAMIKAWWKRYGPPSLIALALVLASIAAYHGWNWYRDREAGKAAVVYSELLKQANGGERAKLLESAKTLTQSYPKTGYAAVGAFVAARVSFEAKDFAAAKEQLQWIVDHARDDDLKSLARYRLAGVLLDEKKYDEALKLLDVKPEDSMAALMADLRGDVFVAKGGLAEARAAYQLALEKTDANSPYRGLVQMKIDSLGQEK